MGGIMVRTARKVWLLVPLLALVFAFACAPAAFASEVTLQGGVTIQADGTYKNSIGPDLDGASIEILGGPFVYTGSPIEPDFKVHLKNGTVLNKADGTDDFSRDDAKFWYFYMNDTAVSNDSLDMFDRPLIIVATFTEADLEVYTAEMNYSILPADISAAQVTIPKEVYTGKPIVPDTTVTFNNMTLQEGVDYDVTYKNNKKVGKKAKAVITGKGNYTGKQVKYFTITKASIKNAKFTNVKAKMYTGKKITPKVNVRFAGKRLKKNRDYTIKYYRNKNVGTAKIKIKGKGNLKGTQVLTFGITPCPLDNRRVSAEVSNQYWTGGNVCPTPTIKYKGMTLKSGRDFTARYNNNARVSDVTGRDASVTVHGKGNYSGARTLYFRIVRRPIDTVSLYVNPTKADPEPFPNLVYNGMTLNCPSDFDYRYTLLSNGNMQLTVWGNGAHYTGYFTNTYVLR